MTQSVFQKHNYLDKDIVYLKNKITEYDMQNAGINILYHNGVFTKEQYDNLNRMSKLEKNIVVGKFLKNNPDISEALMDEFIKIRYDLFLLNDLHDEDVLSIKKDAIFIVDKSLKHLELNENYRFTKKNSYEGYINVIGKEFYYKNLTDGFDIKGISKRVKEVQNGFMFKRMAEILSLDMNGNKDLAFEKLIQLKLEFLNFELPKQFYYDIIHDSYICEVCGFLLGLDEMDDSMKTNSKIDTNLNFINNFINAVV